MRIEIMEKNCKASDKLVGIVEKKIGKLDKYFDEDSVCTVYLKQEGKSCKTELTILYKGNMIRAEVTGENFYDDIDAVLPKIENQIYRHKSKLESKLKKDAFYDKRLFLEEADVPVGKLVRTKTFALSPMTTEEAVEQLDLLGHSFYLKTKSAAELNEELVAAKKELFNLRFQNATNQLDNTSRIKEVRRNIARIQTIITEKSGK